jgi:hypothetical protein
VIVAALVLSPTGASMAAETTPRLGSHTMIGPQTPAADVDALFRLSRAARLRTVRADVLAAWIFPRAADQPEWATLDTLRAAARTHGLDVLGVLSGTPWWNARCPAWAEHFYRCPPNDDAAWARMVEQIAARAPEIRFWEVLNEANLVNPGSGRGEYFYGSAQEYARLLRLTSAAIRRGNPAAKVVFTSLYEPYDGWLAEVLAEPGTVRAFDIANAHFRGGVDKLGAMVAAARVAYASHGFTGPLWVTEMGYPSSQTFQYDRGFYGEDPLAAQRAQARYVRQGIKRMLRSGARRVFVTLRDLEHGWGIFTSEGIVEWPGGRPKPAYRVVRRLGCGLLWKALVRRYRRLGRALTRTTRDLPGTCAPPSRASTTTR